MTVYNLRTKEGRAKLRADRQAELDAIHAGKWPRDTADIVRWTPHHGSAVEWAEAMCRLDVEYCNARDHIENSGGNAPPNVESAASYGYGDETKM